jgi:hypothetical protein
MRFHLCQRNFILRFLHTTTVLLNIRWSLHQPLQPTFAPEWQDATRTAATRPAHRAFLAVLPVLRPFLPAAAQVLGPFLPARPQALRD